MPLIKDQIETFEELAPFIKMTVAPNGVTVGDLAFVSSQTHWSSALLAIGADNTVAGDAALDLFQAAQGDVGQGFSTALTRTETSWFDTAGRLPANQVFVAVECAWQACLRSEQSTTDDTTIYQTIRNIGALQAIGTNFTWELTVGDGITRTQGSIGSYGGLGGVTANTPVQGKYVAAATGGFNTAANPPFIGAQAAQLGDPCMSGTKLRVPLIFPPNINVRIKARCGNAFTVSGYADNASPGTNQPTLPQGFYLQLRQYLRGYLCTMPV